MRQYRRRWCLGFFLGPRRIAPGIILSSSFARSISGCTTRGGRRGQCHVIVGPRIPPSGAPSCCTATAPAPTPSTTAAAPVYGRRRLFARASRLFALSALAPRGQRSAPGLAAPAPASRRGRGRSLRRPCRARRCTSPTPASPAPAPAPCAASPSPAPVPRGLSLPVAVRRAVAVVVVLLVGPNDLVVALIRGHKFAHHLIREHADVKTRRRTFRERVRTTAGPAWREGALG